ncbi:MAG: Wzz/FepE/Etk N-terminal domain-containing protein [Sphingorhabdus sp.]
MNDTLLLGSDEFQQRMSRPQGGMEQINIRHILRMFQRHRLMILGIVGAATLITLVLQLLTPPQYQSVASLQVELIDEVGTNQAEVASRNVQRVANEVKLHRSRSAAELVVRDLDLHQNRKFMGSDVAAKKKKNKAKESASSKAAKEKSIQAATSKLVGMVEITVEADSDLIEIAVNSRSPELSALIANQYAKSVAKMRRSKNDERRKKLLESLATEMELRGTAAKAASEKLANFRKEHDMLVGAGGAEDLAQINRIAQEAASASAMRAGSSAQSAGVARAAGISTTANATSPVLQQLQRQQADLSAEKARLSPTYGSGHPDVVRLNSQLNEVNRSLEREHRNAISAAAAVAASEGARMAQLARSEAARDSARAGQLEGMVGQLTQKAYRNTTNSVELSQLEREAVLADKGFIAIADRAEQVRAQMQEEGVSSALVSPAVPNSDAVAPTPAKTVTMAFIGSGMLALLLVLLIEMIDDRLRTADQIRRHFGMRTLGMLPLIRGEMATTLQNSPVLVDPQSLFSEVARSFHSEVMALGRPGESQSVLITSPLPGDGKSTTALSLAAAAVAMGRTAIVVDLDLRKPGILQDIQKRLDTPDLVDYLEGKVEYKKLLSFVPEADNKQLSTNGYAPEQRKLVMLSARAPVSNPAVLLNAGRIMGLLNDLRQQFDLVVVNAPAVLSVRDARTMCDLTDITLMVARWGHTTIDQMRASLEMLGNKAAAVVFDQVDYAEHARRGYGDSIEFYFAASPYYTGDVPRPITFMDQIRRVLARGRA